MSLEEILNESLDSFYETTRVKPKVSYVFDEWEFDVNGQTHAIRFTYAPYFGKKTVNVDFGVRQGTKLSRKISSVPDLKKYMATILDVVKKAGADPTEKMKARNDGLVLLIPEKVYAKLGDRFTRLAKLVLRKTSSVTNEIQSPPEGEQSGMNTIFVWKRGKSFKQVFAGVADKITNDIIDGDDVSTPADQGNKPIGGISQQARMTIDATEHAISSFQKIAKDNGFSLTISGKDGDGHRTWKFAHPEGKGRSVDILVYYEKTTGKPALALNLIDVDPEQGDDVLLYAEPKKYSNASWSQKTKSLENFDVTLAQFTEYMKFLKDFEYDFRGTVADQFDKIKKQNPSKVNAATSAPEPAVHYGKEIDALTRKVIASCFDKAKAAGYQKESFKESAMITYTFTKPFDKSAKISFDGWHGSKPASYGATASLLSLYDAKDKPVLTVPDDVTTASWGSDRHIKITADVFARYKAFTQQFEDKFNELIKTQKSAKPPMKVWDKAIRTFFDNGTDEDIKQFKATALKIRGVDFEGFISQYGFKEGNVQAINNSTDNFGNVVNDLFAKSQYTKKVNYLKNGITEFTYTSGKNEAKIGIGDAALNDGFHVVSYCKFASGYKILLDMPSIKAIAGFDEKKYFLGLSLSNEERGISNKTYASSSSVKKYADSLFNLTRAIENAIDKAAPNAAGKTLLPIDEIESEIRQLSKLGKAVSFRRVDDEDTSADAAWEFRHWGEWVVPEGEDDDDGDYDWEVLDSKSRKQLNDAIIKLNKKYDGVAKLVAVTGEKNWITIEVRKK